MREEEKEKKKVLLTRSSIFSREPILIVGSGEFLRCCWIGGVFFLRVSMRERNGHGEGKMNDVQCIVHTNRESACITVSVYCGW